MGLSSSRRYEAFKVAFEKLKNKKSLYESMSEENKRAISDYEGPIVLGDKDE